MDLYSKIFTIYPTLTQADFMPPTGTIRLQNDSDGRGDYIKSWTHSDFPMPTEEQLQGVK